MISLMLKTTSELAMNVKKFHQVVQALKTKKAKILVGLGFGFVLGTWCILSAAFSSLLSNDLNDSFWTLAGLELGLAAIALVVCSKLGSASLASSMNPLKVRQPKASQTPAVILRSWMHKLFRH